MEFLVRTAKTKVQRIRDMRDYSQIFSKDAERPAPAKDCRLQNISLPNSGVKSNHMAMKSKQPLESNGRKPSAMRMHSEVGSNKYILRCWSQFPSTDTYFVNIFPSVYKNHVCSYFRF
ncbi:hypothetical protein ACFXTN_026089 [Malus domestica]